MLIEAAPMAGYTDVAFRRLLVECGARVVWTEMVSAAALFYGNKKTLGLLRTDGCLEAGEKLGFRVKQVVQLFGKVPEHFVFALKSGLLDEFDEVNINMGCPAGKIVRNGEGCALMADFGLAESIIRACVLATDKPVSVKFRLGVEEVDGLVAPAFAKMCERAGAARVIIHGRYASQGYSGIADWRAIAEVVRAVGLPVIANGDVVDLRSAEECLRVTGAAGVMMGRATLGAPWAVGICGHERRPLEGSSMGVKISVVLRHLEIAEECGVYFPELRKHLLFYANSFEGAKELKLRVVKLGSYAEAKEVFCTY